MSKRKLLLADDSITIQKVVNLTFADEGVEVITVGDGDAAVEKIAEMSPDLVLADVHMPGLNGYQICEWIRGNPATKELPVILLVGSFEPFDETEAARVGANAYLTKPFQSIRQLVSQVTDLMAPPVGEGNGHHQVEAEPALEVNEVSVDNQVTPTAGTGETNDIDSLYHQSFGEPLSDDRETPPAPFVDAGMDDEMIETSFTTVGGDPGSEPGRIEERPSYGEAAFQNQERSQYNETANREEPVPDVSMGDYQSDPVSDLVAADDQPRFDEEQHVSEFHYEEPTLPNLNAVSDFSTEPENISYSSGISDQADAGTDHDSYVDQFAATEQIPAATAEKQTASFQLDESELLELPPLANEKTIEIKTARELVEEEANKQVVTLSPELMETIVAKVVEKLSKNN